MPGDYSMYLLSGLIPWIAFQQSLAKSSVAITSNESLVKQVVFPLEVLAIRSSVVSLYILVCGCTLLILYSLFTFQKVSLLCLILPLVFVAQMSVMVGIGFILSSVCVFIKDVKEFIQIFLTINMFLMPVIYLPQTIPSAFRIIVYANPFSHMVWVYQDILYFGRIDHPLSWGLFFILSIFSLALGYRAFKNVKPYFGNVV
jgi:lipopolysaccharide transport system permease protein